MQDIKQFFDGKTVFVTGGSGFLGKVLLEKLLRSCPGLDTIYVLIRERKGATGEERLKKITELPVRFFKIYSCVRYSALSSRI